MTYYWIGHSDDFATTQSNDSQGAAIVKTLRGVVKRAPDRLDNCACLIILISYTESNYGIGYIERWAIIWN